MTQNVTRPQAGKRTVTVRELVEGELDLIVGGGKKPAAAEQVDRKKRPLSDGK